MHFPLPQRNWWVLQPSPAMQYKFKISAILHSLCHFIQKFTIYLESLIVDQAWELEHTREKLGNKKGHRRCVQRQKGASPPFDFISFGDPEYYNYLSSTRIYSAICWPSAIRAWMLSRAPLFLPSKKENEWLLHSISGKEIPEKAQEVGVKSK